MMNKKKINRYDYEAEHIIIEDIGALNEKYIKRFIDLRTHFSAVDADFYLAAQKELTEQYKSELALKRKQSEGSSAAKFYLAEELNDMLKIYSERKREKKWRGAVWQDSEMKKALNARAEREASAELIELYCVEPEEEIKPEEDKAAEYILNRVDDLIESLLKEFASTFRRKSLLKRNYKYFTWLLTDYAEEHGAEEIYDALVKRFVKEKKREKFNEQNEDYIKSLLIEFLQSFSEPDEEPEAVPELEDDENVVEEPKDEQGAENGAVDGESSDTEEESAVENAEQPPSKELAIQSTGQTPAKQEPALKAQTDEDILNGLYGLYAVELNEKKKHAPQVITDPSRLLPFNVIILPYKISEETNGGGK